MSELIVHTAAEQVAAYLAGEIRRGAWSGVMPGGDRLAAELGIGRDTAEAALRALEEEGLLVNQGRRRGRLIAPEAESPVIRKLRVAILPYQKSDRRLDYMLEIDHHLEEAGHDVLYTPKSLTALGLDTRKAAAMAEATAADAWLVVAGTRALLEWFAARKTPVMALFGRREGLPLAAAGPDKPPAMAAITKELIGLGHRRIVLLAREHRRLPEPGAAERAFLDTLETHGIPPGTYHLPDWKENADGFHARLEALFRHSPPTALIADDATLFTAARLFLAGKRLRVPEDVSMVCTDYDDSFVWCRPEISHIRWDARPVVRRVLRWAENVAHRKNDPAQTLTPTEFVRGGTIGKATG